METQRLIRIYYYEDSHRSYGDCGTFKYLRVDTDCLVERIETGLDLAKTKYSVWSLSERGKEVLTAVGYNNYSMGFMLSSMDEYQAEMNSLLSKVERLTL